MRGHQAYHCAGGDIDRDRMARLIGGDRRLLERKPFPAYIALIFGLFGEVVQHFNDFIFQRAKKHSLHHQIDFGYWASLV